MRAFETGVPIHRDNVDRRVWLIVVAWVQELPEHRYHNTMVLHVIQFLFLDCQLLLKVNSRFKESFNNNNYAL